MYGAKTLISRPAGLIALTAGTLLLTGSVGLAAADTRPPSGTPATVSADALPTWQVNGVVWDSVTVGNNVYVTGAFTKARPPGTKAGDAKEITASNIFAFDIRTGNPLAGFKHSLNAQGLAITASPNGKALYVGGDFTTADGEAHQHIASISLVTGALRRAFTSRASSRVTTLAATDETVYIGGVFGGINGASRTRLGAVDSLGKLTAWAPTADSTPQALLVTHNRVIVGGHFTELNGTAAYGMGSVSAATGKSLTWNVSKTAIRAAGKNGAITSLTTDGTRVYGSGYSFNAKDSQFEGTFAAEPLHGDLEWVNDCHGDTYDTLPIGKTLYSVGHAHTCQWIGAFKNTSPKTYHRTLAFDTRSSGKKNIGPDEYHWDYSRYEHSNLLHWYPDLASGTVTGQLQGPWTITGNSSYVALGGEFPSVNGLAQAGLTRFATSRSAPNDRGPMSTRAQLKPTATAGTGQVTVKWPVTWDQDNRLLTYNVFRDDASKPFKTLTRNSSFWQLGTMTATDTGQKKGAKHTYRVQAVDPLGNTKMSLPSDSVTVK